MRKKTKYRLIFARLLGATLLISISCLSYAQQSSNSNSVDTLLQKQTKSLNHFALSGSTDSIKNRLAKERDSSKIFDSLSTDYKKFKHRLDSTKKRLNHRLDSLKQLGLPHEQYSKAIDSLNRLNPMKEFQKTQGDITKKEQQISQKLNQPINAVNRKVNSFSKAAEGKGLPNGTKLPNAQQINLPKSDLSNGLKTPALNSVKLQNQRMQVKDPIAQEEKEISKDIAPNIQKDLKKDLNGLTTSEEVKEIGKATKEVTKDVSKYSKDLGEVQSGKYTDEKNLEKDITSQIPSKEMTGLQKEIQQANQQEAMLKSLKNKDEYKKHTLQRARKMATEQFAAQEKQIQPLIVKVNQYQKDADNIIKQTKGLPKQRPPRESVPPLVERFVPAFTWQVQKNNLWRIDVNPSVRFRLRKLISIGGGWNDRIVFDEKGNFKSEYRAYGTRNFIEVTIRRGFSLRVDAERLNAFVPVSFQQQDIGTRKWVWCYQAGLKKDFSFGRGVIGNTQMMYVLYNSKENPYLTKFNVRFGLEFPLKKKRKKM